MFLRESFRLVAELQTVAAAAMTPRSAANENAPAVLILPPAATVSAPRDWVVDWRWFDGCGEPCGQAE